MIWPEVRALYDAGWSIEPHSRTHKHTSDPTYNAVYEANSADVIASKINIPRPNFYVYPYGGFNEDNTALMTALHSKNYRGGVTAFGGPNDDDPNDDSEDTKTIDVWHMQRIKVSASDTIDGFARLINEHVPNKPRLNIQIGSGEGTGTVDPTPDRPYYDYNSVVTVVAKPAAGYHFTHWNSYVANPNDSNTTVTIDANYMDPQHIVFVAFELDPNTVVASAGANGTLSPSGVQRIHSHDSIPFTATPLTGYQVDKWTVDGISVQTGGTTYTLSDITTSHVVKVTFKLSAFISGYIKNDCNVPISGVSVDANNSGGHAVTDANGFYQVWVDYNWTGTVTPTKKDYTFAPDSVRYVSVIQNVVDANYVADDMYDLDCNGSIGVGDLAIFASNWLVEGGVAPGDFNNDTHRNFLDFAMFAQRWLQ
jgi:hypothetical protein